MMGAVHRRTVRVTLGAGMIAVTCALSSCGDSSAPHRPAAHHATTTSSTTTTTGPVPVPSVPTTTRPLVAVPNVIGLRIGAARIALRGADLGSISVNTACNEGTLASQSVVVSMVLPGSPAPRLGATPILPGAMVPRGSTIGLTWSGCYGTGAVVPDVVGQPFAAARRTLEKAGLAWACYSLVKPRTPSTSTASTSTASTSTTTTVAPAGIVLRQLPVPGGVQHPGAIVSLTMVRCPQ
jgi:hypothetical protein